MGCTIARDFDNVGTFYHEQFNRIHREFVELYKERYNRDCSFSMFDKDLLEVNDIIYKKYEIDVIGVIMWLTAVRYEKELIGDDGHKLQEN